MFRRAPRGHQRSVSLSVQPLERRFAMAGDFALAVERDAFAVKADEVKYAEAALYEKAPVVAPVTDLVKSTFVDGVGKHVGHLAELHDRMRDLAAVKDADQAGIDRDVARESRLIDQGTGDALAVGRRKATAFDVGFGGRAGVDPWSKGKTSSVKDPLTGQPLLGGSGGDGSGPSKDDALAAGMAGRSRAMDDPAAERHVSGKTVTFMIGDDDWTFSNLYILGLGGFSAPMEDGTQLTVIAGVKRGEGESHNFDDYTFDLWKTGVRQFYFRQDQRTITLITESPGGKRSTRAYVAGDDDKPRPDDESGTPPRKLNDAEKEAVRRELRGGFGPAGQPRPDGEGNGAGGNGGDGEVLTYLDLAGQPRPDDEGHRGIAPNGPVLTDIGLAGQPVDDEPGFGIVSPVGGGPRVCSGGLVIDNAVTDQIKEGAAK